MALRIHDNLVTNIRVELVGPGPRGIPHGPAYVACSAPNFTASIGPDGHSVDVTPMQPPAPGLGHVIFVQAMADGSIASAMLEIEIGGRDTSAVFDCCGGVTHEPLPAEAAELRAIFFPKLTTGGTP